MEVVKLEPLIFLTGQKGVGKSYYIDNKYKDYFKVETHSKNKQDKSITYRILDAKKNHEKVTLKTHVNFIKRHPHCIVFSFMYFFFYVVISDPPRQLRGL